MALTPVKQSSSDLSLLRGHFPPGRPASEVRFNEEGDLPAENWRPGALEYLRLHGDALVVLLAGLDEAVDFC
jgi:hypothetical protein